MTEQIRDAVANLVAAVNELTDRYYLDQRHIAALTEQVEQLTQQLDSFDQLFLVFVTDRQNFHLLFRHQNQTIVKPLFL